MQGLDCRSSNHRVTTKIDTSCKKIKGPRELKINTARLLIAQKVPVVQMTIGSCRTTLFVSTRLCNKVKIKSDSSQISMAECKGYHATRIYRNHLNQEIRLNIDEDVFDKYYQSEMTVQKNNN